MRVLTVIGSDELILTVIGLATFNRPLAINCISGQLVGRIHPIDAGIDMVFVGCSDLENTGNPVVIGFSGLAGTFGVGSRLLSLDGRVIGHIDKTLAVVFDAIHCLQLALMAMAMTGDLQTKLL